MGLAELKETHCLELLDLFLGGDWKGRSCEPKGAKGWLRLLESYSLPDGLYACIRDLYDNQDYEIRIKPKR